MLSRPSPRGILKLKRLRPRRPNYEPQTTPACKTVLCIDTLDTVATLAALEALAAALADHRSGMGAGLGEFMTILLEELALALN